MFHMYCHKCGKTLGKCEGSCSYGTIDNCGFVSHEDYVTCCWCQNCINIVKAGIAKWA